MTYRIGSLFSGCGGLDQGVEAVINAETVWVSDIDPGANKILAHRHPDIPNLGDITAIDWADVPAIDILTGGFPCQDLSLAGKRAGLRDGTRSGLWGVMAQAIQNLQPQLVVIENVRGILSANAHSRVEPCAWCVGETPDDGLLRALGCVLGDLADLGYDARWHGLRASDIGAPHGRFRVFIVAYPHHAGLEGQQDQVGAAQTERLGHAVSGVDAGAAEVTLLPTPAVNDMGAGKTIEAWDAWTAKMQAKHGNGNGHGKPLAIEAQRLLPTPRATDGTKGGPGQRGSSGDLTMPSVAVRLLPTPLVGSTSPASHGQISGDYRARMAEALDRWGDYSQAIHRWETAHGTAPEPTEPGKNGPRLNPAFVEWMMGLPAGWVTDVPGLTRNQQLKALGNGVHPYQAAEALRRMGIA